LKLLNALYNGRHCIVNSDAVEGTGLQATCHIAGGADEIRGLLNELCTRPFTQEEIICRKQLLEGLYDQKANLEKLMHAIW
jgi:hypothetical protein